MRWIGNYCEGIGRERSDGFAGKTSVPTRLVDGVADLRKAVVGLENAEPAVSDQEARCLLLQGKLEPAGFAWIAARHLGKELPAIGFAAALPGLKTRHLRIVAHGDECGQVARAESAGDETRRLEDHPNLRSIQSRVRK